MSAALPVIDKGKLLPLLLKAALSFVPKAFPAFWSGGTLFLSWIGSVIGAFALKRAMLNGILPSRKTNVLYSGAYCQINILQSMTIKNQQFAIHDNVARTYRAWIA